MKYIRYQLAAFSKPGLPAKITTGDFCQGFGPASPARRKSPERRTVRAQLPHVWRLFFFIVISIAVGGFLPYFSTTERIFQHRYSISSGFRSFIFFPGCTLPSITRTAVPLSFLIS